MMTAETALSNFHKMTLTVMKKVYRKQKTNIAYQSCKLFLMRRLQFRVIIFLELLLIKLFKDPMKKQYVQETYEETKPLSLIKR